MREETRGWWRRGDARGWSYYDQGGIAPKTSTLENRVRRKDSGVEDENDSGEAKGTISKAMHAYLKRAKEHQAFIDTQEKEFVFGRRHLANMMGRDVEGFTQKDIDEAIRYLFPSGLYEPRARPMMRPPQEVYPKQKAAQFDMSGRPHHPFFYTAKPNYYYLLHEMVTKLNSLNKLAPSRSTSIIEEEEDRDSALSGSVWITKDELESRLLEKITDQMYSEWIACLERIAVHSKRDKELEFIQAYRKPLAVQTKASELPPITLEPDGRKSVHVSLCMKKSARADVLVTVPGTGEFKINGKGLDFFTLMASREAVIAPLQLSKWLGKVDVEANCEGATLAQPHVPFAGETSRAIAIRWGISTALAALGADVEKLRLAGYLVKDHRMRERKKPGKESARRTWTWKKR
ncbi:28S ribosomal protein S9, mitochondrial [Orchesella cincta]|uniref:28S ribosomal protein S9, mitochondrial n=1 Tax=Orchesella cincta TaxID=48709 RepID=A0A1D2MVZ2_ORCCI|nr:28S ribosomal protein S9, mitochondrial [Orchesella cincta]